MMASDQLSSSSEDEYAEPQDDEFLDANFINQNRHLIRVFGENEPRPPAAAVENDDAPAAGQALGGVGLGRARIRELVALGVPPNIDLREGREWCNCGNCIVEEMWENRYCCQEVEKVMQKNKEEPYHNGCITTHPWFERSILNPATLQIAYWQYVSQYEEPVVEGGVERRYRYTAYRQFVRWCWGFLGKDRRVPMTSCVLRRIREAFPDPNGNYTGFKYPLLDR